MNGVFFDPERETLARPELEKIQLAGLRKMVEHILQGDTFYAKRLRAAGVTATDINSLQDYREKVPLTIKDDLRDAMRETGQSMPHLCVDESEIVLAGPSAGTSGEPTWQAFTAQDKAINTGMIARLQYMCGLRGDGISIIFGTPFMPWVHTAPEASREIGVNWVILDDHNPGGIDRYVKTLLNLRPTFVHCGVGILRLMMDALEAGYKKGLPSRLKTLVLSGAELGEEARKEIKERLGADVCVLGGQGSDFNIFGAECPGFPGHVWGGEDHYYLEIVDPDTFEPVTPGDIGELVITDFYRQATPHVRWRTEDLYREIPEPLPDGRTGKRLECFGRVAFRVEVGGEFVYAYQVEAALSAIVETRNVEFALLRPEQSGKVLSVCLQSPQRSAEEIKSLQQQLSAKLALPVVLRCHDQLPVVGYKTLRVISQSDLS